MLAKRIIPCLDVDAGRVVKGTRFVNLKDAGDPVELAAYYDQQGADEVIFLDITASAEKRPILIDVVRRTSEVLFIPLTVGGGLRTIQDIQALLRAGADKVSLNTAAVEDPSLVQKSSYEFGAQCIVLAMDAKKIQNSNDKIQKWEVYIHGGRTATGFDAVEWAKRAEALGAGEILLTSMDRDGTQEGYDLELTSTVASSVTIPVIASGGAGTLEHVYQGLTQGLADAALLASTLHYRQLTIAQIKEYLWARDVPIRTIKEHKHIST